MDFFELVILYQSSWLQNCKNQAEIVVFFVKKSNKTFMVNKVILEFNKKPKNVIIYRAFYLKWYS